MENMTEKPQATIVVPAYNEEKAVGGFIAKLKAIKGNYEIIFVDDGSCDNTAGLIEDNGFRVIRHPYNKGYGAALKTGIRNANSDIIIIMDSDGQHNPEEIDKLMSKIDKYDMVVGARTTQSHTLLFRKPLKKLLTWIANYLAETKIPDLNSGFRAIKIKTLKKFLHILPNGFSFSTTITLAMFKGGYDVCYVPITTQERVGRKSNVGFIKDGSRTLLIIVRSIALFDPLRFFAPISVFLFVFGLFFTIYGIFVYGRAPLIGALSILSSIIIFFFGILADQISILRREGK